MSLALALDLQQELGAKLKQETLGAFVAQVQQQSLNLETKPRSTQLEHFTAFVTALNLNAHGDGCLPTDIKVSP